MNAIFVSRANSQDKAYLHIKEQIVNLALSPGTRILADAMAKQLHSSRTPVREALGRLEQEGLIVRSSGWGYSVKPMALHEIYSLFRLRELLEVEAALQAIKRMDDETLTKLRELNTRSHAMLAKGKVPESRALNRQFHLTISAAAGDELLHQMLLMLNDRIRLVGSMHLDVRSQRLSEIALENRAILKAIELRDARKAKAAVLRHIRNSKKAWSADHR